MLPRHEANWRALEKWRVSTAVLHETLAATQLICGVGWRAKANSNLSASGGAENRRR